MAGRVDSPLWHTDWVRDELWTGGPALDTFHIDDWTSVSIARGDRESDPRLQQPFVPQGLWRVADDRPTGRLLRRTDLE